MAGPGRFSTIVSTKGQVILPKAIRDLLQWEAGTRLLVETTGDGVLLKAASVFPPTRAKDVFGSLPVRGESKTVAEMNCRIEGETKGRHGRNR